MADKIFWSLVTPTMRLTAEGGSWFADAKLVYWTGEEAADARATLGRFFHEQVKRDIEAQRAEPIGVYTDFQAVDDGMLVDVSHLKLVYQARPVNRVTRTVWDELEPSINAVAEARAQGKALAIHHREATPKEIDREIPGEWARTLRTKLAAAGYAGGDIIKVPPHYWLLENEIDGYTLMLPSDY